jgi:hypothetical protein
MQARSAAGCTLDFPLTTVKAPGGDSLVPNQADEFKQLIEAM